MNEASYVGGKCEKHHEYGVFGKNIVMVTLERKKAENGRLIIGKASPLVIFDVMVGKRTDVVGKMVEDRATISPMYDVAMLNTLKRNFQKRPTACFSGGRCRLQ